MRQLSCKVLVIGAGPGGYVCAIRSAQLGLDTIIVEQTAPGGTCLNVGCIPSKALIHAADEFYKLTQFDGSSVLGITATTPAINLGQTMLWKDGIVKQLSGGVSALLHKAGVQQIIGTATFQDGKTVRVAGEEDECVIKAEHVVIATGSAPIALSSLPFGGKVISSTDALNLTDVPSKLLVVGGGYIGLEIGSAFAKLGSAVTIVESAATILPQYDAELTKPVSASLKAHGITVLTATKVKRLEEPGLVIESTDGAEHHLPADKILVTVGRRPLSDSAGIPDLGLAQDNEFLAINDRCQTSMKGVYAIGDVTGEPMLAHRAMAQGEMVSEIIAGHPRRWDKVCIPAVCFTDPEIVTCGMSPADAEAKGIQIKTGQFPFAANGRALTTQAEAGFVRVVAQSDNGLILGLQAVGAGVSEMSSAFSIAIEMCARLDDLAHIIHAHPTQSEALQEACLVALGQAVHI